MEKELRRNQSILRQSGTATIIFELWSVIKFGAYCIHNPAAVQQYIDQAIGSSMVSNDVATVITMCVITVVILIDFVLRVFVGRNAMAASRDKKHYNVYIAVAILLVAFTVYSIYYEIFPMYHNSEITDFVLVLVIDLSSLFILLELIVSAFKIKHIKRKMTE